MFWIEYLCSHPKVLCVPLIPSVMGLESGAFEKVIKSGR